MKRTQFPSAVLLASVLISTATSATFAGGHHGGGNGGGAKGNSGGMQMMRSGNSGFSNQFKQNVGNNSVPKQQFTQKFTPSTVKLPTNGTVGNIKTFPNNHVLTGKNVGINDKIKIIPTLPSSPTGPVNPFPAGKIGGGKFDDKIKIGPHFPLPTGGVKVPGGPIVPGAGGSGGGMGGGSGSGSGSGSGGGSGSGSGSGGGSGNCHSHYCGNWWFPIGGWGYNNCYNYGYCGTYPNYCGTGYYGSYCNTYGPAVYTTPVVVNPAPVSVSTPVVVNVDAKETEQATTVASTQTTPAANASPEMIEMALGQTYAMQGPGLGNEGRMMLEVSDIALGVKVEEWTDAKVGFTLPMFGLSKPTNAKLHVVSNDGKLLRSADVRLVLPQTTTAQK